MKKILLIGPFPEPITGVSLANKVAREVLDSEPIYKTDIINTSYHTFDENIGSFSFRKLLFYLLLNLKLYKVFRNQVIYITPGQTFFGITKYAIFILFSYLLKKEIIIHVHGNYLSTEYQSLLGIKKKIFYFLISKFSKGIVLSESLKNNLTPFLEEKNIYILPNFAENFLIKNSHPIQIQEVRIIYLSNLMKEKGILTLLRSLIELESKNIPYLARIAGNIDPNSSKKIFGLLNELKNAKYLGVVKGAAKKELLDWGNIFVLPTYYKMEGQPIAIIEAMATNNVIITTPYAGIPDIVNSAEHGFYIKKGNAKDLVDKIIFLYKNKSVIEEISKRNKLYFAENFTVQKFKKGLINIINTK